MKKLFLILAAALVFAFDWSGNINWAMGYNTAKNIAKEEHKLIMVDVSLSECPPCRYLASKVYTDKTVSDYINKHFIPVFYLADKDNIPVEVQNYFTGSTPTILFIKPNGELFYRMIGARPPKGFLEILKAVYSHYGASNE